MSECEGNSVKMTRSNSTRSDDHRSKVIEEDIETAKSEFRLGIGCGALCTESLYAHKCSNLHAAIGNQMSFGTVVPAGLGGGASHHQVDDGGDLLLQLSSSEDIIGVHDVQAHGEK